MLRERNHATPKYSRTLLLDVKLGCAIVRMPHAGAKDMSRVIKLYTPTKKETPLPKTAALTKAQAEHKAWLKKHGVKLTKNALRT